MNNTKINACILISFHRPDNQGNVKVADFGLAEDIYTQRATFARKQMPQFGYLTSGCHQRASKIWFSQRRVMWYVSELV